LFVPFIGQIFENADLFKEDVLDQGKSFGVLYISSFSVSTNQYYIRCSYFKRKDAQDKDNKCPAKIYANKCKDTGKIIIKKIDSRHNHFLSTKEDILAYKEHSRKYIPEETKKLAFALFKEGDSASEIFRLIKNECKANNKPINFTFASLKNYLYDKNKGYIYQNIMISLRFTVN